MAFRTSRRRSTRPCAPSGVQEGLVLVNTMHITASVFINDDERGLHHDFGKWLEELAPFNPDPDHYHHNRTGEDNADAHLKRQIMGREVVVAITKGQARLRAVGADLLWRVRREPEQTSACQGDRGVGSDSGLSEFQTRVRVQLQPCAPAGVKIPRPAAAIMAALSVESEMCGT